MEEISPKIFHIGHISPARHNWNYPSKKNEMAETEENKKILHA
jgi:hypothetical protein